MDKERRTCTREVVQVIVPYDQCLEFVLYSDGECGHRVQKVVAKVDSSQLCQVLSKQNDQSQFIYYQTVIIKKCSNQYEY